MHLFLATLFAKILIPVCIMVFIVWLGVMFYSQKPKKAILPIILAIAFAALFFWQLGQRIVKPNEIMLVVDKQTGQIIRPIRTTGVTNVPLLTTKVYTYPAQSDYQWCPVFTPSTKGGASLKTTVCFEFDASKIDWENQFRSFNGNINAVTTGWQNGIQSKVASAISNYVPRELTDKRPDVETSIVSATESWFSSHGITDYNVIFKNWNFENQEAQNTYDQALLSQTKIDIANAEREAATIKAETQKLNAHTQRDACDMAGMISENSCLQYLWLTSGVSPSTVILSVGDNNSSIAIPVGTQGAPVVEPTPTN